MWNSEIKDLYGVRRKTGAFGVEIEVEGRGLPQQDEVVEDWLVVADGSLRPNPEALEYVLAGPKSVSMCNAALIRLDKSFKNKGTTVNDSIRAGVHIHMNMQDWTLREVFTLMTAYYILEEVLVDQCGTGRQGNLFCLRAKDAEYVVLHLSQAAEAASAGMTPPIGGDNVRYAAMNLAAIPRYGSLEFRAIRTTADFDKIKWWLRLFDTLLTNVRANFETPVQLIETFSFGGEVQLLHTLLGPDFAGEIQTMYTTAGTMENKLTQGVRLAQEIAYSDTDWGIEN